MPWKTRTCKELKSDLQGAERYLSDYKSHIKKLAETGEEYLSDEIEFAGKRSEHFVDQIYDGLPDVELSIKKAKEIMGEDFYGHEHYEQVFGRLPDLDELGRVPFRLSELRKAKEKGMRLILRYDNHEAVAVPSAADSKRDDLGIAMPRNHQVELMEKVTNGWVLVSKLTSENNYAFRQAGDSLNIAQEVLGEGVNREARDEIFKWQGVIDAAAIDGDKEKLMGLLMDLIANKFSEGKRYLVPANEAIYDALITTGGELDQFKSEIDSLVTGTLIGRRQEPHFLKLNFRDQEITVEAVPVDQAVNRVRYQIRV